MIFDIPIVFFLFALTLLGVAIFHHHTLLVALTGLATIIGYKLLFGSFDGVPGLAGLSMHVAHEWALLANLLGLLTGFAMLSDQFEKSHLPALLPALLPNNWYGGLILLAIVFVMSTFLDNIAAAIIGGTVASSVFRGRLHVGYLAAIVASANAGGAGSVIGDTTTTMMWIAGIAPGEVVRAFVPALVALAVISIPASLQQQAHSPIVADAPTGVKVDWARLVIVGIVLSTVVMTNVVINTRFRLISDDFPFLAAAVWVAILVTAIWRAPNFKLLASAALGGLFLLSLVLSASLMPVESLPHPSTSVTIGLGVVSALFDNIPLTKLALEEGGYDWGLLAFAVGYGGSMMWFGSSAGVALLTRFGQAKSVGAWLRYGWHVPLGYIAGCAGYLLAFE